MACAQCGSTTATESGTCTVCDPWAAPAAAPASGPATRRPTGRPKAAAPKRSTSGKGAGLDGLPAWLKVLARTLPPADADLEQAWRRTVRMTQANLGWYALLATCCIAGVSGVRNLYPIFMLLLVGYGIVGRRMRQSSWLYQAVAVVGSRPDIGYRRFARIPALVRVNNLNKVFGSLIGVLLIVRIITVHVSLPLAFNIALWALIWALAATTTVCQYALHDRARKDLDRMLATL